MTDRLSAPFVFEQFVNAPRELVYAAFTEAEHLSHWMRPPGMVMTQCEVDAREGGSFHYALRAEAMPLAPVMWGKWTFRELKAPERIVAVVQFSDAAGGVTRHPMAAQWPLYTLSTTTLVQESEGTRIHLEWRALNAEQIEEAVFNSSHAGMTVGWSSSMQLLASYLGKIQAA